MGFWAAIGSRDEEPAASGIRPMAEPGAGSKDRRAISILGGPAMTSGRSVDLTGRKVVA
jgi:hypothetical protein